MPQIRLTGHIDVPTSRRTAIEAALAEHIGLTRTEPGCLRFDVTPDAHVPGRWHVAELFESRAAFEAHQARAAASPWGVASAGIDRHFAVEEIEP